MNLHPYDEVSENVTLASPKVLRDGPIVNLARRYWSFGPTYKAS